MKKLLACATAVVLFGCNSGGGGGNGGDGGDDDTPTPIGQLTITDAGTTISATTTGLEDTVLGPVVVGDATFTFRVPAVAIEPGVEITMTPVTLGGAPFETFAAFRFEPAGTTFMVPATLVAEGLPAGAKATAQLGDDGLGTTLTFIPSEDGVARAAVEHFSVAAIVDAATDAAVGAAGVEHIPDGVFGSMGPMAAAFNNTITPALENADQSLITLAFAVRVHGEWNAAMQARDLGPEVSSELGGRTFADVNGEAVSALIAAGQRVLADLSQGRCRDNTGRLRHPLDWIHALSFLAFTLRDLGGEAAEPSQYAPCVTIALPSAVRGQGATIPRDRRFQQVFVALDATSPTGVTAPVLGTYGFEVTGAVGPDGLSNFPHQATSPALTPIDLDRGTDCESRSSTLDVSITAALKGTLHIENFAVPALPLQLHYVDEGECPARATLSVLKHRANYPSAIAVIDSAHVACVNGMGTPAREAFAVPADADIPHSMSTALAAADVSRPNPSTYEVRLTAEIPRRQTHISLQDGSQCTESGQVVVSHTLLVTPSTDGQLFLSVGAFGQPLLAVVRFDNISELDNNTAPLTQVSPGQAIPMTAGVPFAVVVATNLVNNDTANDLFLTNELTIRVSLGAP